MKHKKPTNKVTQCEDGNPDCFHGGKAACTWCGTNNWDFNPKYNKNYCNRCGYAEDYPKSKCGQCGETIYRSSHTCSKAPPEPVEDWQPAWEKLKCKTTSASIIGFENDADIKFIRNLLAQERERQKKIDVDICLYEYLESIKKDCTEAYNLGWHDAAFTIRNSINKS